LAAATTGVEGLEAIIPVAPNTSYYEYYRSNGLVRAPSGWQGEDIDVLFDYINSGLKREHCAATVRAELAARHDRRKGDFNEFWASRDYLGSVDKVRAATLMAHAFGDWNVKPSHSVRIYEALRAQGTPAQLYMHQGGHGGQPPHPMMNRWFTRYLYGLDNGVEQHPLAWIVREGASNANPTPYGDYPNPASGAVPLRLQAGGATAGGMTFLAHADTGTETLIDQAVLTAAQLAGLQQSPNRLLYRTPTLSAPLHLSGTPSITVRMASSKPALNLSVYLYSFPASGSPTLVTRGWADPQNHRSQSAGEPLVPGQFNDVTFNLEPDDQIIPAGAQLGLLILSSDYDFTVRPRPGTQLTVDLSKTTLQVPVVGGRLGFAICPAPDTRATVVVGDIDSGVPNRTVAGTCTINDHIVDDEEWSNAEAFMAHLTEVADLLLAAGLVNAEEREAIVGAGERSGVGT
jgi:X-Pro dipeptidyl-peptidase